MKKKKILIFIDWYLPGFRAGGPIRSVANLILHLREEYEFFVVTRNVDYLSDTPYPEIIPDQWNDLPDGTKVFYFSNERLNRSSICRLIDETPFDVAYLNGLYSRFFTLIPLRYLRQKDKKVVLAARGMLSAGSLSVKPIKKKSFLMLTKITGLFNGVIFHATTPEEEKDIRRIFGKRMTIRLAGNLPAKNGAEVQPITKSPGDLRLVNIARIAPEKNLLYALQVLSCVKSNVTLNIYGPVYDKFYWQECNDLIRKLPPNILVNYRGAIESDLVPAVLSESHMLFMPSTGENFGHIILQSLAAGRPVIVSDRTPWRNLQDKGIGWDISLAHPDHFADVIESACQMTQTEFDRISEAANKHAESYSRDPDLLRENICLFQ